ncbi:hypothetical protein OH492_13170 [Vibrio chagasii]|nr:hypothetical protein [Vibrio chagasii]
MAASSMIRPYRELNASELVPVLVDGDVQLNQSLDNLAISGRKSICGSSPDTQLIPEQSPLRYQALAMAQDIAMEIHPLEQQSACAAVFGAKLSCEQEGKWNGFHY